MGNSKTQETKLAGMVSIDITYKQFLNRLSPAFQELTKVPSNPKSGKLKYAIKRSLGSFQDAHERYNSKKTEIFEERAKLDDNGNPVFDKENSYLFETKELRKEALDLLKKLDNEVFKLTIYQIKKSDYIAAVGNISIGQELNLEGFMINDVDEEQVEE